MLTACVKGDYRTFILSPKLGGQYGLFRGAAAEIEIDDNLALALV